MATATFRLDLQPRRMMTLADAARYCAMTSKAFERDCPMRPVALAKGVERYDMRDLDRWLDGLRDGEATQSAADILARLG